MAPIESPLRPRAPPLDGSEPLVLTAATRLAAVTLVAGAALEQLATPPVPTDGEPLGIEVDIDGLAVVIVLTLGLPYCADLHKSIRPTRSAVLLEAFDWATAASSPAQTLNTHSEHTTKSVGA